MNPSDQPYPFEIDVRSVKALFDQKEDFLLIDCREPGENQLVKINGATLVPMREIPQRLEELAAHKAGRIVVHCHHGGRSQRVAEFLRAQGFVGAQNMTGGIDAWAIEIEPGMTRY